MSFNADNNANELRGSTPFPHFALAVLPRVEGQLNPQQLPRRPQQRAIPPGGRFARRPRSQCQALGIGQARGERG